MNLNWRSRMTRFRDRLGLSLVILGLFANIANSENTSPDLDKSVLVKAGNLGKSGLKSSDVNFPTPKVENVFKAWKPVDFGNPLRDVTMFYAPPSLERVQMDGRSLKNAESRSLGDSNSSGEQLSTADLFPVVIAAEPKPDPKQQAYSVYGSPNIDYSSLYSNPPKKLETDENPLDDGREEPNLAFRRDYFNPTSSSSQNLDSIDFKIDSEPRRRNDQVGGIRYMEPPNRAQPKSYFYYKKDSPHYKDSVTTAQPLAPPTYFTTPPPIAKPSPAQARNFDENPGSRHIPSKQLNAVVYSYQDEYGQKQKVGVILDDDMTPEASSISYASPDTTSSHLVKDPEEKPEPVKIIPLQSSGSLEGASASKPAQAYPLGAPYKLPERPKFFPPQTRPPIFKIRPKQLEGVFGPTIAPRYSPDRIEFPADHEYAKLKPLPQKSSRRQDFDFAFAETGSHVYKVEREMEYRRPNVILQVGDSNELYRPDEPTDRIWKPDFTDVLEEGIVEPTERPFPYEELQKQESLSQESGATERGSTETSKRALVLFPDDPKIAGPARPLRAVSNTRHTQNRATPKLEIVPNYRTVIGLSYDDNSHSSTINDDFENIPEDESQVEKKSIYSKQELYDLCIKEVPDYLRDELCGSILEAKPKAQVKDVVPPKNAHLVQTHNTRTPPPSEAVQLSVVTQRSTNQESYIVGRENLSNFLGIPLELPKEIKKDGQVKFEDNSTNDFKVYKTFDQSKEEETTIVAPLAESSEENYKTVVSTSTQQRNTPRPPPKVKAPGQQGYFVSSVRPEPLRETGYSQNLPPPQQAPSRPDAAHQPGYLSRIFQFFGGNQTSDKPKVQRRRLHAKF